MVCRRHGSLHGLFACMSQRLCCLHTHIPCLGMDVKVQMYVPDITVCHTSVCTMCRQQHVVSSHDITTACNESQVMFDHVVRVDTNAEAPPVPHDPSQIQECPRSSSSASCIQWMTTDRRVNPAHHLGQAFMALGDIAPFWYLLHSILQWCFSLCLRLSDGAYAAMPFQSG